METLASNDFTLTFRTMQRLIPQARTPSKWYVENLDENRDTSTEKIFFEFMLMGEAEKFIEVRSTREEEFKVRHISELTQPLTQEMARHFNEGDWFILHSDHIGVYSSGLYASLSKRLMAAIPADKFLFIFCLVKESESPLETLIRHCHRYQLQESARQMHSNLEIHAVLISSPSSD